MSDAPSQKFNELLQLSALGINTPASLVVSCEDYSVLLRSLKHYSKAEYWVIRTPFNLKRLIKRPAYASAEIEPLLELIFNLEPNCKLFITELIPAIRAGVFAKARDFIYCEYVPGALQSLVRDGVTPVRILLQSDGSISFIERNAPAFFYSWSGAELKTLPTPSLETLHIEDLVKTLVSLAASCPPMSIIEWVQAPDQQLYAVDFKHSAFGFLGCHQDIYQGLVNGCLVSLGNASHDGAALAESGAKETVMFIDRPLYSYVIDGSAFSAERIILRSGGLLSHLILECSYRHIQCMISQVLFNMRI